MPAVTATPDRARPLRVSGVSKNFSPGFHAPWSRKPRRRVRALRGVSFDVPPNSVFGLIGANGSGKSTLIRALSTLVLADEGTIEVFGYDVEQDSMQVRRLINRVSADPSFFGQMSAIENLLFFGRVYGFAPEDVRTRSVEILDRLGLTREQQRAMVKELSRGQQQKIAVARAFLTAPVLMLLDEPTTGLDPRSKRDVQDFVREVQRDPRRHDPADHARHGRGRGPVRPHREQLSFMVQAAVLLVSGVYYSVDTLPGWLQVGSALSPATYLLDGTRATLIAGEGLSDQLGNLAAMLAFAVILIPTSVAVFSAAERWAKRTGRLKRQG